MYRPLVTSLFLATLTMTMTYRESLASDIHVDDQAVLTDFTPGTADMRWYVVNDNVMGGKSDGVFARQSGKLVFAGSTDTNGGGFSSIRTRRMDLDLSGHDGIRLEVLGDGRRYTWRLTSNATWRGRLVSYWADFETIDGEWTTVDIPFTAFVPRFRGFLLQGPNIDATEITGMGLMIYDKQDGPFEIQLSSIHTWSATDDALIPDSTKKVVNSR